MADEENPETPETPTDGAQSPAEGETGHAVPSEDAAMKSGRCASATS